MADEPDQEAEIDRHQLNLFETIWPEGAKKPEQTNEDTMTINLKMPDITELKPKITVFGVGGAGGNAVNNMIRSGLEGVDFVVANTDAQALSSSKAERIVQMGLQVTEGLGAGSQPHIGREAAEEVIDEINDYLSGSHMAFITAGMGGGTGTGAAPVVARAARELGILTVGVVTKPFQFEGARRMRLADSGIEELQANVDTLIVIPNQNLFRIANEKTTFADAFAMADEVLYSGVACITDLMVKEGLINLDFADVRSVMQEMGKAMMGTGEASGDKRAIEAAEAAIANPLLDETSMQGAQGLLISITGGTDLTLFEVDEAATRIREEVDPDANIILGATFDEGLEGIVRVSVVATGIETKAIARPAPAASEQTAVAAPSAATTAQTPVEVAVGAAAVEAALADVDATPARTIAPAKPQIAPKPQPAKSDPAVTIEPIVPGGKTLEASKTERDIPSVEDLQEPVKTVPVETPVAKGPFIPPAAEKPAAPSKMPSVDDFPQIVQAEIRAKTASASEIHSQEERGAMSLLERIKSATLGPRKDDHDHATDGSLSGSPEALAEIETAERIVTPRAPQPSAAASVFAKPGQVARAQDAGSQGMRPNTGLLDAQGRVTPQPAEKQAEDQLEIPAFLRRQTKG